MRIDQRNAGASVTITANTAQYITDRFIVRGTQASKLTAQQSSVAPTGFSTSLLVTSSSSYSVTASDYFVVEQRIEGFNVVDLAFGGATARQVTLSFWVRSSLTGTFGGAFGNSALDRTYPFSYSIAVANTWEQKTVTITGDAAGTWLTNNGIGLSLFLGLGTGSSLSGTAGSWAAATYVSATGATSVVGTNGATFYITGVQLEPGTVATPFERRSYGAELALCQRYYENNYTNQAVGSSVSGGSLYAYNQTITPSNGFLTVGVPFKVTKRAGPTTTLYSYNGSINQWHYGKAGQSETLYTPGTVYSQSSGFGFFTSGIPTDQNTTYGMFSASAEL